MVALTGLVASESATSPTLLRAIASPDCQVAAKCGTIRRPRGANPPPCSPEAANPMVDMVGNELTVGRKVWAEGASHLFKEGSFKAEVIEGHRLPQPGMVWLRQIPTPAQPYVGEEGGWVTEWSAKDCLVAG